MVLSLNADWSRNARLLNTDCDCFQVSVCVLVNIFGFVVGMAIAISSVMFPRLLEGETGMFAMKINTDEMSYIGDFSTFSQKFVNYDFQFSHLCS